VVENKKEFSDALDRVSLQNKELLKKWSLESGRKYMLINSIHFVDALSMEELEVFQQLLIKYGDYRNTISKDKDESYGELLTPNELEDLFLQIGKKIY
jgi:hypothetical protein